MNLTKKILILILLICLVFSFLYFLLYRSILAEPIIDQKNIQASKIMTSALMVFENETNRILTFTEDWAWWDSMYRYASTPNKEFEKEMATDLVLRDADLSIILILNKKQEILLLDGLDNSTQKKVPFTHLRQKKGPLWDHIYQTFHFENSTSGIVHTEHGPLLTVSSPILTSNNEGPTNGRLLMGRFIDKSYEGKISKLIGEKTTILINSPNRQTEPSPPDKMAASTENHFLVEETDNHIIIHYPIKDVGLNDSFTIRVDFRKGIFKLLEHATRLFYILLIAGFLMMAFLIYYLTDKLVVRRVKKISEKTNQIFTFDDLSLRISISNQDEITQLAKNINKMLQRLQTEKIHEAEVEKMLALNEKLIFLGRVSSGIAHEINNPLFAIANSLQILKGSLPTDNPRVSRILQLAENEMKRVRNIVNNMHKLSIRKIENMVRSDLTAIMTNAVNVVIWGNLLKNTHLELKKEDQSFPAYCNPDTLQQVFLNLIVNAVDAMDGGGKLIIDISLEGDEYKIDFIDTGPGFDDEMKKEIFTPFQTTKIGKGSGLGLHISNNIVNNHGGSITLNDDYKDGAHMIVRIPKGG